MKDFQNIVDVVASKDWKFLVRNFLPVTVTVSYSFTEVMHIIHDLLLASSDEVGEDGIMADFMRDYCVNLMIILKEKYPTEWKKDWKNDAFLGIICGFVYREEESFKYIRNAYEQLNDPPQSLILAYISSGETSDHFLSKKEIIELSQKAIKKGITYEAALHMSSLAYGEGDLKKSEYWKQKAAEAEENGLHTSIITPNVLKDLFRRKDGYQYEE